MPGIDGGRERIAQFWRAIELFSPQSLPRPDARGHVEDFYPGEPMPWEPGSQLASAVVAPGKVWRHEVFAGVYDIQRVAGTLVEQFGDDDPASQRKAIGDQSALFGCTVDADGLLVEESAVLSSCAWAIGRLCAGGRRSGDWLSGFDEDVLHFGDRLALMSGSSLGSGIRLLAASMREAAPDAAAGGGKAAVPPARLETRPLTGEILQRFTAELTARLGVGQVLRPRHIRVRSYQIPATRAGEAPESSFLNSFCAEDLARVARALHRGDAGPGLLAYLTSGRQHAARERIDVRQQPQAVRAGGQPERIPLGRWPADSSRPLILSQQFAVNKIMEQLGGGRGLFAVNGPPGTGKTTMLRDVIAAIVVERALRLAELASPQDAFRDTESGTWSTSTWQHTVVAPRPSLTGFEIVVAAANNGAVENITTQIPGPAAIGPQWRPRASDLDYFRATAAQVHGEGAWAMVAARLGKRANRGGFVNSFWWSPAGQDGHGGMGDVLTALEAEPVDWPAAVDAFTAAADAVRALAAQRQKAATAIERLAAAETERRQAWAAIRAAEQTCRQLVERGRAAERSLAEADAGRLAAHNAYDGHRNERPGLLVSLATRFRAGREWHADHLALRNAGQDAARRRDQAAQALNRLRGQLSDARKASQRDRAKLARLGQQTRAWRDQAGRAAARWGDHVPAGPGDPATDGLNGMNGMNGVDGLDEREKSSPWADEEFTAARTALFLAALGLHKAFLTATAPTVRGNLNALMDILAGHGPRPRAVTTRAAWQTFFLMMPVVSSTFASIDRLFAGFGRESLGWLLIDEAGQAAPQQAAGAIWRARRTVAVGDPLQIEPVVTMPWGGQQALSRLYGVAAEWAPSRTSVQRLADQAAPYGTWLRTATPDGSGRVWVGTPLRVHRRCDRPLFDVCNRIAYDGLMVYGTAARAPFHGHDVWYDVRGPDAGGHWIPAEGDALRDTLARLKAAGVPAAAIRVISPFRQVVRGALAVHGEVFPDGSIPSGQRETWVGTVHKMQGREADVVVLVLGGQPDRPRARSWAAERPNLLNVAVSRARRRLYVIGNRELWKPLPFFGVLAGSLPVWPPAPGSR